MNQSAASLTGLKSINNRLSEVIDNTVSTVVEPSMKTTVQESISLLKKQLSDVMFDAFSKDVWSNSSLAKQQTFLEMYLTHFIQKQRMPSDADMVSFYRGLFSKGNLSNTFQRVQDTFKARLQTILKNLQEKAMTREVTHRELIAFERTPEYRKLGQGGGKKLERRVQSPDEETSFVRRGFEETIGSDFIERQRRKAKRNKKAFQIQQDMDKRVLEQVAEKVKEYNELGAKRLKLAKKKIELYTKLQSEIPNLLEDMASDYIKTLLGTPNTATGLFSQHLQQVNSIINTYGITNNILSKTMADVIPTLKEIGDTNLSIIYGPSVQGTAKVIIDAFSLKKGQPLQQALDKAASLRTPFTDSPLSKIGQYLGDFITTTRRYTQASLLGGVLDPATRFYGYNVFTAPLIFLTTIGHGGMNVRDVLKFSFTAFTSGISPSVLANKMGYSKPLPMARKHARVTFAPDDEVMIVPRQGGSVRTYTAGELRTIIAREGIESSRADIELYDTTLHRMIINAGIYYKGVSRGFLTKVWDNISPSRNNYLNRFQRFQDSQMRTYIFMKSLDEGKTVNQAAELARTSILDYSTVSAREKKYISNIIYFYAFQRTMLVEVVNSMFSKSKFAPKMLRTLDQINKQAAQDYYSLTDDQLGRLYNIFTGTIDGVDTYASGPPNPLTQGFQFFMNLPLYGISAVSGASSAPLTSTLTAGTGAALSMGESILKSSPYANFLLTYYRAQRQGPPKSFPVELIRAAEEQGELKELIREYDLVATKKLKPGAALASDGNYYTWRSGELGTKQYLKYELRKLIGYTGFQLLTTRAIDNLAKEYGVDFVSDFINPVPTRAQRDRIKGRMGAEDDYKIQDPFNPNVQIVLPTASLYNKKTGKQNLNVSANVAYILTQIGLATFTASTPPEDQIIQNLKTVNSKIKKLNKEIEPER